VTPSQRSWPGLSFFREGLRGTFGRGSGPLLLGDGHVLSWHTHGRGVGAGDEAQVEQAAEVAHEALAGPTELAGEALAGGVAAAAALLSAALLSAHLCVTPDDTVGQGGGRVAGGA
jgi:hypothetical protein